MTLTRFLRLNPGVTEVPAYLRALDGAFPGATPMRDPISLRLDADLVEHLRAWGDGTACVIEATEYKQPEPCPCCRCTGAHTYGCTLTELTT